jgi:hypothetical protein
MRFSDLLSIDFLCPRTSANEREFLNIDFIRVHSRLFAGENGSEPPSKISLTQKNVRASGFTKALQNSRAAT